jgi:hypothetical protein
MSTTRRTGPSRRGRKTQARVRAEAFAVGGRVVQDALAGWLLPGTPDVAALRRPDPLSASPSRITDTHATFQIAGFRCDAHALRNGRGWWYGQVDICLIGTNTVVGRVRLEAEHPSAEAFLDVARGAAHEGVDVLSRYAQLPAKLPLELRAGPLS